MLVSLWLIRVYKHFIRLWFDESSKSWLCPSSLFTVLHISWIFPRSWTAFLHIRTHIHTIHTNKHTHTHIHTIHPNKHTHTRTYIQLTQTNTHTHAHAHLHTIHTHSKCRCSIFPIILYFGFGRIMIGTLWIGCGWGWWGLNSLRALRTNLTKYGGPVHASCDLFDMLDQAPISGISSPISFKMDARKRWQRRDKQRTHKSREIKLFHGDVSFL